jgi:hypothetical protein
MAERGGVYGISGGSIPGPILASRGTYDPDRSRLPSRHLLTSLAGARTYGIPALTTSGNIAPHRTLGPPCRAGGLIRGYLRARPQPYLPEPQTDQDLRDLRRAIPGDWAHDQGTGRTYRRPRHLPATGPDPATVLGLTHRSGAPEPTARRRSRSPDHRYLAGLSPVPAASRCTG